MQRFIWFFFPETMQSKPSSSNRQLILSWLQLHLHSCYQLYQLISSALPCHIFFSHTLCQWVQVQRKEGWGNKNAVESADGSDSTVREKKKPESAEPKFLSRQKFIQPSGWQWEVMITTRLKEILGTTGMNAKDFCYTYHNKNCLASMKSHDPFREVLDFKTEHRRTHNWAWLPISLASAIQLHMHTETDTHIQRHTHPWHIPPTSLMSFNLPFSQFQWASEELSAQ